MKILIKLLLITVLPFSIKSQNFFNHDLEGEVTNISSMPYGWEAIPQEDPICLAVNIGNATPDLYDVNGLIDPIQCKGNPYSGKTFVSGLLMGPASAGIYHEGIQQKVNGFNIDSTYTIFFYQTNVKQTCCANDSSGSWAVYLDDILIDITVPSISNLPPNSTNLNWEQRQVTFTATSESHLIKFIPIDDDSNINYPSGGIRMGIDYIYINEPPKVNVEDVVVMPNVFSPNNDGINDLFAPVKIGPVKTMHTSIMNRWGFVIYESNDIFIQWDGIDKYLNFFEEGVYFWKVTGTLINNQEFYNCGYVHLTK